MIQRKLFLAALFIFISGLVSAQKITFAGKEYQIKGDKIFLKGKDVTHTFSISEKEALYLKLNKRNLRYQL